MSMLDDVDVGFMMDVSQSDSSVRFFRTLQYSLHYEIRDSRHFRDSVRSMHLSMVHGRGQFRKVPTVMTTKPKSTSQSPAP